jgi:hypothetical protein
MEKEEITKSRAVIILTKLKIELALKERELIDRVEKNFGDMGIVEKAFGWVVDDLKYKISILTAYIDGKIIRADGEGLRGTIQAIDEKIAMLSKYKEADESKLLKYTILEKLLGPEEK